ncbi:jg9163 [Pararge aegeria aegeria]|uniref:Jg9163 protein n=1 Tax=Pararge aegeria aegeria TaxID=348720 RepID=A0A8S4S7W8_9NEOP|nr:jg9163 [Pararge aegeria aegeria]
MREEREDARARRDEDLAYSELVLACMEADETPTQELFRCRVAEQRAAYLGSPASLPEALGNLGLSS